jgi:tetratricopeptide (TPR) repeat protein
VLAAKGDPFAALRVAESAASMARSSGEDEALARAYGIIDWANFVTGGDRPRHGEEAIEIFERLGQIERSVGVKNNMGAFAFLGGRWDEAIDWYRQAVEAAERSGNVVEAARTRANIAEVLVEQNKFAEAIPYLDEAERVYKSSNALQGLPFARMVAARAVAGLGDVEGGLVELERVFADQIESGDTGEDPQIVVHLASLLITAGLPEEALERIGRFVEAAPDDVPTVKSGLDRARGLAHVALGDLAGGLGWLEGAWRQALEDEDLLAELESLRALVETRGGDASDPSHLSRIQELEGRLGIAAPQLV